MTDHAEIIWQMDDIIGKTVCQISIAQRAIETMEQAGYTVINVIHTTSKVR